MPNEILKNHIRIGNYVIQYNHHSDMEERGFVVLDTTMNNAQIGAPYESLMEAMEQVLQYWD